MKIVIGGQLGKNEIEAIVKKFENVTVDIKNDLDAVMAMKANAYDYYLGACVTGGGGALAMAIALLGKDKCLTVASPNGCITEEEIIDGVKNGKIAFGFTPTYTEKVVPVIINALLNK